MLKNVVILSNLLLNAEFTCKYLLLNFYFFSFHFYVLVLWSAGPPRDRRVVLRLQLDFDATTKKNMFVYNNIYV